MRYNYIALGAGGLSALGGVNDYLFSKLAKKYELVAVIDTKGLPENNLSNFQSPPNSVWVRYPSVKNFIYYFNQFCVWT